MRQHRGDDDYSADKAASLRPAQLSNYNRHAATSHCGPCFQERCPSFFLHPLNGCLPLDPTLSSTHSRSPSQRGGGLETEGGWFLPAKFGFPTFSSAFPASARGPGGSSRDQNQDSSSCPQLSSEEDFLASLHL
uniref:Uncharacterized protein n=1 Tax=Rousettus aegyptiacus TaxID=9407 RepID=A0A7J8H0X5_ROUAE|nr:hypothetical protein HJG63_011283 [Rousettus aegyptiacus]